MTTGFKSESDLPGQPALLRSAIEQRWGEILPEYDASTIPLFTMISRLSALSAAFHQEVLRPFGVAYSEYTTLALIHVHYPEGTTSTELQRHLGQTSGGMTQLVRRLGEAGYIRRNKNRDDRRSSLITLTQKGIAFTEQLLKAEAEAQSELFRSENEEVKGDLFVAMSRMVTLLSTARNQVDLKK